VDSLVAFSPPDLFNNPNRYGGLLVGGILQNATANLVDFRQISCSTLGDFSFAAL